MTGPLPATPGPGPRVTAAMCAHGRSVAEPKLSPDGSAVAFVSSSGGRAVLVVVPVAGGPELVVTAGPTPRPVAAYGGGAFDWLADGSGLVFAATDGTLAVVAPTGGPARTLVGTARASSPAASPDGSRVAYVHDGRDVAVARLDGGWPAVVSAGADFALDPVWSPDGARLAWHEWDVPHMPWDEGRVRVVGADGSPVGVVHTAGVQRTQPRFSPDGSVLGHLSDADGWLNLWAAGPDGSAPRPLLCERFEHGLPSWGPGQRTWCWSPAGDRVAFVRNEDGFGRLCVLDVATGAVQDVAKGFHDGLSWRGDHLVAVRSGARTPTCVVAYDVRSWGRTVLARGPVAGFEEAALVEPTAVTWPGDDGGHVHGRLYRPPSATHGEPAPMVVWVHGGPTGQWPVTFNPRIAYFVERGWAVLVPDHRGSTGFGRAYTQAMRGRWGELDTADVAAGIRHAGAHGWCDPSRVAVMGGSAGGFTVLNLLAHHPGLCAAGIDLFGVTDLLSLDETTHRFEKHYLHSIVGPLPGSVERYRDRSPLHHVERITTPLLILQGTADEVVPPEQSRSIAQRLGALGRPVEHVEYDGEGHGWQRAETVMDELARIEDFLRRHVLRWR